MNQLFKSTIMRCAIYINVTFFCSCINNDRVIISNDYDDNKFSFDTPKINYLSNDYYKHWEDSLIAVNNDLLAMDKAFFCNYHLDTTKVKQDPSVFIKDSSIFINLRNDTIVCTGNQMINHKGYQFTKYFLKKVNQNSIVFSGIVRINNGTYSELFISEKDTIINKDMVNLKSSEAKIKSLSDFRYISSFSIPYCAKLSCSKFEFKKFSHIPNYELYGLADHMTARKHSFYLDNYYWNNEFGLIGFSIFDGNKSELYLLVN